MSAKEFAKVGKIELAIEQLLAIEPPIHDESFWQTVLDVGSLVREKAVQFYKKDFDKPVLLPETTVADFFEKRQQNRLDWVSVDGPFSPRSGHFDGCIRAEGVRGGRMQGIVISPRLQFGSLNGSVALTHDAYQTGESVIGTLLIASDNHFHRTSIRANGSIIICRRDIPCILSVKNSIVISSENIVRDRSTQYDGKWIIQENEAKPLNFIRWFETIQLGIEVTNNRVVEISNLEPTKEFARAGCKIGDEVREL